MRKLLTTLLLGAMAAIPAGLHAQEGQSGNSQAPLMISGTSTVRPWQCRVPKYQMTVQPASDYAQPVLDGQPAIKSLTLKINVNSIDCGIGKMNEHLRKALKADKYGEITFNLGLYNLTTAGKAVDAKAKGQLTIDATSQPVTLDVHLTPGKDGTLQAQGQYTLNMKDYGVKPPKLMLGMLKVHKDVKVAFDVSVDPTAPVVASRSDNH